MKTAESIVVAIFVLAVIAALFLLASNREKAIMSIEYCWDSNGNHYVAPDTRCTH